MKSNEAKEFILWAKAQGVRRVRCGTLEVEFDALPKELMPLDPKSLANTLTDSMPPDSAMLFASSEGIPEEEAKQA